MGELEREFKKKSTNRVINNNKKVDWSPNNNNKAGSNVLINQFSLIKGLHKFYLKKKKKESVQKKELKLAETKLHQQSGSKVLFEIVHNKLLKSCYGQ
jgi:hypothetical protein